MQYTVHTYKGGHPCPGGDGANMSFYKTFANHRGCGQWPVVPDQERLIKPEEDPEGKKVGRGGGSAHMVDGAVPVFPCQFFIILNLVFLKVHAKSGVKEGLTVIKCIN